MPTKKGIQEKNDVIDKLNQQAWDIRVFDSPGSFKLSQRSLGLARKAQYKKGIAEALRSMGFSYLRLSKNEEAIPLLNESLRLFKELNDLVGESLITEYLAVIKRNRGELGASMELLFRSISLSQQTGASENEAIQQYQLGVNYKYLGNFDKALEFLFKSISIHKENKNRLYQSYPINMIGSIYFETGDFKRALEYYKEGLKLRQEFKDKLGEAGSIDNIGYTLLKLKKYKEALTYCKRGLAISKTTGDKRSQANTLQHLAEIYARTGNTKQAMISSNKSRKIRKVTGDKRGEAEILLFLANLQQDDRKQQLLCIKEALHISEQTKSPDIKSKAHYSLYIYYKEEGKHKEANSHLERYFKLENELQKNSVNQKMVNLEITRKAEETRKEAEVVMNKNEELTRLNRELEIQTALERVRAVAMGMKKREDMLDVCATISLQLESLGVKEIRNVQTAIFYEKRGTYMNYEYYAKHKRTFITETLYTDHKIAKAFAGKMLKGKGEVYITHIRGEKKVKEWLAYQKKTNVFIDTYLEKAASLNYYWHSLGPVALGISTYVPLSNSDSELFKRFLNVFELAYTRYFDIEKAYAQAREAQVDAAVERVRAKALAMHRSDEVLQVVQSLKKEMADLGLTSGITGATIFLEQPDGRVRLWDLTSFDTALTNMDIVFWPDETNPELYIMKIWRSKENFVIIEQERKDFLLTIKWIRQFDRKTADEIAGLLRSHKLTHGWHPAARLQHGWLCIDLETPPSSEFEIILPKMAAAFDLAYKRFLDLQKAEAQAKEARIEASLEKVRAQALGMHKPEDLLNVCKVLFKELLQLGFDQLRNAVIHTLYDEKGYFIDHDYSDYTGGAITIIPYSNQSIIKTFLREIRKSSDAFLQVIIKGNELEEWKKVRKKTGQRDDPRLKKAAVLYYYIYSVGTASIGISAFQQVSEEKLDVLKRFRNVFDFAYRRYMDVAKAEEQAAEARIEASLERVRAAAMSMHKSGQLINVAEAMYKELVSLGFDNIRNAQISIRNLADNRYFVSEFSDYVRLAVKEAPIDDSPLLKSIYSEMERSKDAFYQKEFAGSEYIEWKKWRLQADPKQDPRIFKATSMWFHLYSLGTGYIGISTFGAITSAQTSILKRFRNVFDLAYRRYVDVAKAEVQAREAQIEVAVERVRAKALAMHRSEDLHAVVVTLKNELMGLEIPDVIAATIYLEQDDGSIRILDLTSGSEETHDKVELKLDRTFRFEDTDPKLWVRRMWDRTENYFVEYADKADFNRVVKWLSSIDPAEAKIAEKIIKEKKITQAWLPTVKLEKGILNIDLLERPSQEIEPILVKMGASFDLAYKRFVDLQRAEAQTREAQVELALERVRARTMAMQKSDELEEVVALLYKQFQELDFGLYQILVSIIDEKKKVVEWWSRDFSDAALPQRNLIPIIDHPFPNTQMKNWKNGVDYYAHILEGDIKESWEEYLFTQTDLKNFPKEVQKQMRGVEKVYLSDAFMKHGVLQAAGPSPLPEDKAVVLKRFAKVLDLAYTRYLDIEQAQAQAREAQIEAALERVRSASMAMHASDELQNVIRVLTDQLTVLGFAFHTANFITNASMPDWEIWISSPGSNIPPKLFVPYFNHRLFNERNEAVASGKEMLTVELNAEEKASFLNYFFEHSSAKNTDNDRIKWVLEQPGMALTTVVTKSFSLSVINYFGKPYSESENEVIRRLAYVFEQSYTRFLDLQKAEAQAKESQVQLSLERVRARTMAMQRSNELPECANLLFHQMQSLGMPTWAAGYCTWEENKKAITLWMSSEGVLQPPFKAPTTEDELFIQMRKGYEEGKLLHVVEMGGEDLASHYRYMRTLPVVGEIFDSVEEAGHSLPTFQVMHYAYYSKGFLLIITYERVPEAHEIFTRFASVFDQTYTRFLDLQKAEAQSRESQIELSLERVRARTMAMQRSDELMETAVVLFDQLKQLGENIERTIIGVVNEDEHIVDFWATRPDGSQMLKMQKFPIDEPIVIQKVYGAWRQQKKSIVIDLRGEELESYFQFLKARGPQLKRESFGERRVETFVFFSRGFLGVISADPTKPANVELYERFAAVFDQTYTRFLDLQKAEAQVREAQIETALERVRSATMAMHKSEEVTGVAVSLNEELLKLGFAGGSTIIIIDKETGDTEQWAGFSEDKSLKSCYVPYFKHPIHDAMLTAWEKNEPSLVYDLIGNEKESFDNHYFSTGYKNFPENDKKWMREMSSVKFSYAFMKYGAIHWGHEGLTEEQLRILQRFSKVFEQSYTRFLDLRKAEAQAREAQIELGLERVRARAMAMQTSDELKGLIGTVFTELTKLDLVLTRCVIMIYGGQARDSKWWMANSEDPDNPAGFYIKAHDHPPNEAYFKAWGERKIKYTYTLEGQTKKNWDIFLFNETELKDLPSFVIEGMKAPDKVYLNASFNNFGNLTLASLEPLSEEHFDILLRFAKVFDLTYTRFNDLQKAEAQAKEAMIEASLERIRAKAMAMHHSDELDEVLVVLWEQFDVLGIRPMSAHMTVVDIPNNRFTFRETGKFGNRSFGEQIVNIDAMDIWKEAAEQWRRSEPETLNRLHFPKESLPMVWQVFHQSFSSMPEDSRLTPDDYPDGIYHIAGKHPFGYIGINQVRPSTPEEDQIVIRFASEFGRAYQRFLDLKKAEEQAREARVEAALERVRAKAMAMHQSEDFNDAIAVVFEELKKLDIGVLRCGISVLDKEKRTGNIWVTSVSDEGSAVQVSGDESFDIHPLLKGAFEAWLRHEDFYYLLQGEDLRNYYNAVKKTNIQLPESQMTSSGTEFNQQYCYTAVYQAGGLFAFRETEFPDEAKRVIKRFAGVFDLTYKRFVDLQKAEAQAREAKIEASLERVRSKAMAMHSSQDLADTIGVFYNELHSFSITPRRCGVGLLDKEERIGELFTWNTTEDGHSLELVGKLKMVGHPVLEAVYDHWISQTEYHPVIRGNEIKEYYQVVRPQMNFPDYTHDDVQYGYFFFFKEGGVYAWTQVEMKEEELQIYRRFTSVLSLTYKRYKDLQHAEAQTHKANIEVALERVRARALAMQQPEELIEVAEVLRHEMGLLGVEELETCSIYINDETINRTECWYALKDLRSPERKLVNDHFALDLNATWVGREMLNFYRSKQKKISIVMKGANRKEWITYCEQQSAPFRGFYGEVIPDRTYHLYKFSHGAIGAAAAGDISAESWELLERTASVFSLAYSRFKDLTKSRSDLQNLKEEKNRAEKALEELQVTQRQLIQSEKMASLGELTAGIAHEIQNPLNFVNNFSEVSNELLDEMVEEVRKGNLDEVQAIVNDVKQNLEKINHHGKRADGIVKGMLQHSRSSSGQKELTDINALADEYLRLAYHGLRAKDKTFNAKFEAKLDPSVEKINIVPQDIGRVILNLITNAFYVVAEKKKKGGNGYEPTVIIRTKNFNDKVEIKVEDNGSGIPAHVLEKIFQPFFTTKPTGQGTGLGLSLSYDIVKAHGGELKVTTTEGEGSQFTIHLPLNNAL